MDAKFFSGLYDGDCGNGVKLGMGLTGGDFWGRVGGCENLYRGTDQYRVDFDRIIATGNVGQAMLSVPVIEEHSAGSRCLYVLRRCSGCGDELENFDAAVEVVFDLNGYLQPAMCNRPFGAAARTIDGDRCELLWYYCPLGQADVPEHFNVYYDNGIGVIDYDTVYDSVDYHGPRFYRYEVMLNGPGVYMFGVRAVSVDGWQEDVSGVLTAEVGEAAGSGVGIVRVEAM